MPLDASTGHRIGSKETLIPCTLCGRPPTREGGRHASSCPKSTRRTTTVPRYVIVKSLRRAGSALRRMFGL